MQIAESIRAGLVEEWAKRRKLKEKVNQLRREHHGHKGR